MLCDNREQTFYLVLSLFQNYSSGWVWWPRLAIPALGGWGRRTEPPRAVAQLFHSAWPLTLSSTWSSFPHTMPSICEQCSCFIKPDSLLFKTISQWVREQLYCVYRPPILVFNFTSKVCLTILILAMFIKQVNPAATQPNKTHACNCTENSDSTSHKWGRDKVLLQWNRTVIDSHYLRDSVFLCL